MALTCLSRPRAACIRATAFELDAGTARADRVAAGLAGFANRIHFFEQMAVVHNCAVLCKFLIGHVEAVGQGLFEGRGLGFVPIRFRFRREFQDHRSGAESERRGSIGVVQNCADCFERFGQESDGAFAKENSLFGSGGIHFEGEGGKGAGPMVNSIAVKAGFGGGFGDGGAGCEQIDDAVLLGRELAVGKIGLRSEER